MLWDSGNLEFVKPYVRFVVLVCANNFELARGVSNVLHFLGAQLSKSGKL